MNNFIDKEIRALIDQAQKILLVSHVRPDGDAVGSILGLGTSLIAAGKQVQMILTDGIPSNFLFLPGSKMIKRTAEFPVDVSIVLDISDLNRIGNVLLSSKPDINIDHHITNLNFATINLVEPASAATSCILVEHIPNWGLTIPQDSATALLAGIVNDTLGFRTSNTSAATLRQAAQLMDLGANLPDLYYESLMRRSYASTKFWGYGLTHIQQEDGLVWTSLTVDDRKTSGYSGNDDADLINFLSTIDEAKIAIIFVEHKNGHVKVSWRAKPGMDVSQIALSYGGGGHPAAAGADIPGTLADIQPKIIKDTLKLLATLGK
jgi:phosphoesterase RecJ-like protein